MNVRLTRVIVSAAAFALVTAVVVDSVSAQLFGRFRRDRANACCYVPVANGCSTHNHAAYQYGSRQQGYSTSPAGFYSNSPAMSRGYMSNSYVGSGSLGLSQGCGGSSPVASQANGMRGYSVQGNTNGQSYSGSTFAAPDSSSPKLISNQFGLDGNQNSTQTSSQSSVGTGQKVQLNTHQSLQNRESQNQLKLNQDDTIRGNTELNQDGINRNPPELNLDGSIRNETAVNPDGTIRSDSDLNLDGSVRDKTLTPNRETNGDDVFDENRK